MDFMNSKVTRLFSIFDTTENRDVSLKRREPITKLLESELTKIIDIFRPDFFLEIGAFEASFSQEMKALYPDTPVLALEANPRVFEFFQKKVEESGVEYLNKAATSQPALVEIFIPEKIAGKDMPRIGRMGSLREVGLRDSTTTIELVEGVTIDELTEDRHFSNGCAWIDVEGVLKEVIQGGSNTLAKCNIVYTEMEISPVWNDQALAKENIMRMHDLGFELVARDCQKWFQFNGLFVRKNLVENDRLQERLDYFFRQAEELFSTPE